MIFAYNGFVGEDDWYEFVHFKAAGLQNQPAGFAGQFLYLNWSNDQNKNLVDIETYKILYDIDTQLGVEPTGQLHNCLQYCVRKDIFELTPLDEKIDFTIIGRDGGNIFDLCFAPALIKQPTSGDEVRAYESVNFHTRNNTHEEIQKFNNMFQRQIVESLELVSAIEDRFFKLIKAGEKYGYDTDAIIEKRDLVGSTVFETATLFSNKICNYILNRNIRVNNILVNFVYPVFNPYIVGTDNFEKMLKKGINPKVIPGEV